MLLNFVKRLAGTPGSVALHESQFLGFAIVLDLRLLGVPLVYCPGRRPDSWSS